MKKKTIFALTFISDAKLRRFLADSKQSSQFFSNLYGQTSESWPNRGKTFKFCPKEPKRAQRVCPSVSMGYSFTKDYKMEEVAIAWGGNAGEDTTQNTDINNTGATDDSQ